MEKLGKSNLWKEKYRPKTFKDIIIPDSVRTFLNTMKETGQLMDVIFDGPAGTGKTTTALAIVDEMDLSSLYVNTATDGSIDDVRFKVKSFATSKSLFDDKLKVVILDEADRLTPKAADSLKVMIEETTDYCRFIFITNHFSKMIPPIVSRCKYQSFGSTQETRKELLVKFFGRCKFILENENVEYDKVALGKFVAELFPDMRRIIGELQGYNMSHGKIDEGILNLIDDSLVTDIVKHMKEMKFDVVRTLASEIDPQGFFKNFYDRIHEFVKPECRPDVVVMLNEYACNDSIAINKELNMVACLTEMMKTVKWK